MTNKVFQVRYALITSAAIENYFSENDENYPIEVSKKDNNFLEMFLRKSIDRSSEIGLDLSIFVIYKVNDNDKEKYKEDALDKVKIFINVLELTTDFGLSIKLDERSTKTIDYAEKGTIFVSEDSEIEKEPDQLDSLQKENFRNIFSNLFDISNKIFQLIENYNDKNIKFFLLALRYYSSSNLYRTITNKEVKEIVLEKEFLDLIFCLECLLNENPGDISFKIASRTCLLYSILPQNNGDWSPSDLFVLIKKLYKKRNNLVHGKSNERINEEDVNKIKNIVSKILVGMVKMCFIFKNQSKDYLIEELDYCLVDDTKRYLLSSKFDTVDISQKRN